jgi:hypothetical protein
MDRRRGQRSRPRAATFSALTNPYAPCELAAALEDGGATGKDRGGDFVVEGQLSKIRKYSAAGWPWLVDEAETMEVEVTHD